MATMTVSLPDPMKDWIEEQVKRGDYASTSDYVRDAVRRDRDRRDPNYQYTLEEFQQMLEDSANSGISEKTPKEIFEEARQLVAARRARFGL
ncbi:MAG: type toxin-antitoxin system ParD family antitoxin [Devosia sp.]|uniref:type II toxin-antitoxin system ParD family antitoxin n=1 Tax=Devosia sp. TaxID=1871048 RepID=UPI0026101CE1|nr:type II toxin-antitoxin system ParD family antitoxin [Devosia sp.]MDB5528049.1 type toxin-antitoxin system ParD family antitoxin [Devosia sp.]